MRPARLQRNQAELLRCWSARLPIHNNRSETDLRDMVKKRHISAGPQRVGRQCRDTFASSRRPAANRCLFLGVPQRSVAGRNVILTRELIRRPATA